MAPRFKEVTTTSSRAALHEIPITMGAPIRGVDIPKTKVSSEAPRPIGVDPQVTGAFSVIKGADGAVISDRTSAGNAAEQAKAHRAQIPSHVRPTKLSGAPIVVISLVVGVFVLSALVILWRVFSAPAKDPNVVDAGRVEQTQAEPGVPVHYDGYDYATVAASDGGYDFVRTSTSGSDPLVLFHLEGTPVGVVLFEGAFLVPENLDGSWDIVAWVMGDGSVPTKLVDADGESVVGTGSVSSAVLDGSSLLLTFADGATQSIPLSGV